MGKFNQPVNVAEDLASRPDATVNYEEGLAFKLKAKTDLTLRAMTWMVGEPKFYGDAKTETSDIESLIASVAAEDPEYLLKLAAYARNEMYLRSAPIYLLVESAKHAGCKPFLKRYVPSIVKRADELTETIALFTAKNGEIGSRGKASLPNSLKKGLAEAFKGFSRYQLAKYNRGGKVKLKDVLRLVHPKPKDAEMSETFKMVLMDTLPIPETWETEISGKGNTRENWERIMPKMGYMAMLRNLRNFLKVKADPKAAIKVLTDPIQVAKSKQFPYRFYSAYKALNDSEDGDVFAKKELLKALEAALTLSVTNIPKWEGRTFVSGDNSGSMSDTVTEKSKVQRREVAGIMASIADHIGSGGAVASVFGKTFKTVPLSQSILENTAKLEKTDVGHSTNAWLAIDYLLQTKTIVDRIMLFSDLQCYNTVGWGNESLAEGFKLYKRTVNPKAYLYSFDLAGYGSSQFPEDEPDVCLLGGFSDRVFEFVKRFEQERGELTATVSSYSPFKAAEGGEETEDN